MNMLKNEWKRLLSNKILLISTTVILFIPILYGAFFLKSVWDPYNSTGNLPVAVVNEDKQVDYQGKTLDVGNELVDNLKKNKDLGWHFTTQHDAEKGLQDGKYYMIVTIPQDFSANAATVLDNNPKKMQLDYKINPSQNYIAEVVTKQGASQLKTEVATSVTKEYAKTIFAKIQEVASGMNQAADGAHQLNDGSVKLADGNQTITENLSKLASSSLTFKSGASEMSMKVGEAADGVTKLADGANQLNAGVSQAADGANQLATGADTLSLGLTKYTDGVRALSPVSTLADGSHTLTAKIGTLASSVTQLQDGAGKVAGGQEEITQHLKELSSGVDQAAQGVQDAINQADSPEAKAQLEKLQTGVTTFQKSIQDLNNAVNAGNQNQLSAALGNVQTGLAALEESNNQNYEAAIDQGVDAAIQQAIATNKIDANNPELAAIVAAAKQGATTGAGQVNSKQNESLKQLKAGIDQLIQKTDQVGSAIGQFSTGASEIAGGTTQLITQTQGSVQKLKTLNGGLTTIQNGLNGSNGLIHGSEQLASGSASVESNLSKLNSDGVSKLQDGSQEISTNLAKVAGGVQMLNQNSGQLISGSQQLAGGLNQMTAQLPAMQDGTSQLAAGLGTLQNGMPLLQNGAGKLADGAGQISDGSGKLADGSKTLGDGISAVQDGTHELSGKLSDGAKQISDTKATNKTYNMFAAPTKLSEEKLSEVPNYGHGLAPYVLSLGLYVGALVFNFIFPIRRPSMTPTSGLSWWFSKFSIGFVAAVLQAVILDLIMLALGLSVNHLGEFFMISILTSLTYMFIVMFLAMSFGNPGRFIAMVLLVLQLGGAGGTFPMPLTNSFFNAIHPFLPMSYSVYGFRQAISSGLGNTVYLHSALILAGLVIAFNALLIGTMYLRRKKRFKVDNQSLIEEV
ncbi:YhgE/Pip domain-containing protein [Listeria costaricensis]|uniref:YhgE/Pip domain-containing protein n=1 Tax=Listeria costaricensis TaxID=2026604 RepID=UPI000C08AEBF|nr:YhgE/Pip domain-containing protein [Listeria costaricensis]